MKKTLSIVLVLIFSLAFCSGCENKIPTTSATPDKDIVVPLPETIDVNSLENCTIAVSLEKGDVYLAEDGKTEMNLTVYSYELYDMADIASLEEGSVILRRNEEVEITKLERLESGLVRINGGEENGGFDLISNDNTVYYEVGMNDIKSYYELGKVKLSVSDEFEYIDESDLEADAKRYSSEDFLTENIDYSFYPNNTSVIIEDGVVIKMNKVYTP